ncbi:Ail/Lom family outer membrane beta-barrel protein [Xenorhabdus entomophaga]|uniref:Ail/Lom family outer membrane beta-barrel protein n=1 Tax=Xenorhabdus entomophaga TaxID=3136257 RepID=UPI0030F4A7EA
MNRILIAMFVLLTFPATQTYAVEGQTTSVGYASGHFDKAGEVIPRRMNFNHYYQMSPDWGVVGSFSWLKGDKNWEPAQPLLAGPAYRINHYFSLYGIVGIARLKWGNEGKRGTYFDTYTYSDKNMTLAWGTGVLINPLENINFYISYKETQIQPENESYHVNGLNIEVGYHF